ncbi:MAG: hypothetical protein Q9222_001087 [Ikaeria aurantiellina]
MGSSAKKRKDKKKDFQKPKLKVGKARPKPNNFTDTNFNSKALVLKQQFTLTSLSSEKELLAHHVSLLTSRNEAMREDAVRHITLHTCSTPIDSPLPLSANFLLPHLIPLLSATNPRIWNHLLQLFPRLLHKDLEDHVEKIGLHLRCSITSLSTDIQSSSLELMDWMLLTDGEALVSCPGGWMKNLKVLMGIQGWRLVPITSEWTSDGTSFGRSIAHRKNLVKGLKTLTALLWAGFYDPPVGAHNPTSCWPLAHTDQHMISKKANPFGHLNLWGPPRDEDSQMYEGREERQRIFQKRIRKRLESEAAMYKKAGGDAGREANILLNAITEGMKDFNE